jgi:hypothetical protein
MGSRLGGSSSPEKAADSGLKEAIDLRVESHRVSRTDQRTAGRELAFELVWACDDITSNV